jgi:hypothetical protein
MEIKLCNDKSGLQQQILSCIQCTQPLSGIIPRQQMGYLFMAVPSAFYHHAQHMLCPVKGKLK